MYKNLKKVNFEKLLIPKFDKSIDDRLAKIWQKIQSKPDVVIFEGWCRCDASKKRDLIEPINDLERIKDLEELGETK